jgi:hypothetical protein
MSPIQLFIATIIHVFTRVPAEVVWDREERVQPALRAEIAQVRTPVARTRCLSVKRLRIRISVNPPAV